MYSYLQVFVKNGFPAIFDSHIEFLCKMQKRINLVNGARYSYLDKNFSQHPQLFDKNQFTLFFAAILNFYVKCKNTFISETVPDRGIPTKFLTLGVYTVICSCLPKMAFPPFLVAILKFCIKCKTVCILETVPDRGILTKFFTCKV